MTIETTFRSIFFTLFIAVLVIRLYFGWKIRRADGGSWFVQKEAVEREGWWSILLRFVMFLYMIAVAIAYAANPPWLSSFVAPFPIWLRWMGVVMGGLGLLLLVWVHDTLGRHWSTNLQLKEVHTLVTGGPYRWARHPMYTALFAFFVGLALTAASWLIVLLVVISIAGLYARIGKEEGMMVEQFGDEYCQYMKHTGRFLPGL
ncbi:MAG: isoprenylcysteine carboxylmethyltransferase family protein [Thermoflexales bacterium]|nr:isoprenylcysteine carboxylmethyltransferase family protein [Thermoflexales bacterium]